MKTIPVVTSSYQLHSRTATYLDCFNKRPVSYKDLKISFLSQKGFFRDFSTSLRGLLILELRGDVPAHSKSGHVPEAGKNLH